MIALILGLICQCAECVCEQPTVTPTPPQVACESPLSFSGGTLWKPQGDHSGKLVILLAEQHDYSECKVKKRNGGWEDLEFTGRSNGNRQTWRGSQPGGPYYAGKLKDGGVLCDDGCFFPIPGSPKRRWE